VSLHVRKFVLLKTSIDRLVQLFLVAGYLVMYRITPGTSLHLAMRRRTNLLDAYVCSGYFAALALPQGQYDPTRNPEARRYQDGLETDDPEEDILFMVWYRRQPSAVEKASLPGTMTDMPNDVPALSAKRKILVFRTRSKLERDAWCWALNSEIERVVRAQKAREARLRETGNLMNL
jgi:Pleckstrin homology domain